MSKPVRMEWVDASKGLSIILVVMMYAAYNTGQYTGEVGFLHYVVGYTTPLRMPEFFLISGLFLSKVIARPWRHYTDRRVVHYLYFYGLWAAIMIGLKVGLYGGSPALMMRDLTLALVEPYGVLWFIYMLAIFGLVTKIAWQVRMPHWLVIAIAASLQMSRLESNSYVITQFAAYYVFFYLGYVLAPLIFRLVAWAETHVALAVGGLCVWALTNGLLVFFPGFAVLPRETEMGYAAFPPIHLALAVAGALAVCVMAALLCRFSFMRWLCWLGERSLVVYVAFTISMSLFRAIALKSGLLTQTGPLSLAVLVVSIASPVLLYLLVKRLNLGKFLFERPGWARIAEDVKSVGPDSGKDGVTPEHANAIARP